MEPTRHLLQRAVAALLCATTAACGVADSHRASSGALRDWLAAVEDGEARACGLEAKALHRELVAEHPTWADLTCRDRVKEMASLTGNEAEPPSGSEVEVVEQSQGEALIEVTRPGRIDGVQKYWMILENGQWVVAGPAN